MKRTFQLRLFSLALTIALGLGVGCGKKPDDGKISSDIQSRFSQDSGLSTKQLTAQANNGVVTLAGTVDNDAQREAASRQAASVAGVKEVINNLQVSARSAAVASAAPAAGSTPSNPGANKVADKPTYRTADRTEDGVARKHSKSRASEYPSDTRHSGDDSDANPSGTEPSITEASQQTPPPISAVPQDNTATGQTAPPPAPSPRRLIVDQGTQLTIRLIDPIDSEKNQTGDTFHATLNAPLTSDGEEAVPAGTEVTGHLVEVKSAGKFAGQSVVVLQLDSFSSGGKTYSLQTDQYRKEGKSRGKNTAEKVGGGAILGGIIGAIAGGGKGAAIGTAAGAGVGGAAQAASKSQQIKLPSETVLNFILQAPITVVQASRPDADRPKLVNSPQ
jgi:hypothetical protein